MHNVSYSYVLFVGKNREVKFYVFFLERNGSSDFMVISGIVHTKSFLKNDINTFKLAYNIRDEAVKNLVSMDEKSLLIGTRYVKICCRISFLIIVLPVYLFLYIYFKFFAHQSGISSRKILCGRCPHLASGIRLGLSGNTANADGIRLGHFGIKRGVPAFSFYRYRVSLSP